MLRGHQVLIATENTRVVSYINKQGGTHSLALLRQVVDLFMWLQTHDIVLRARHIPGCLNVIADCLSRPNQPIPTEWSLNPEIVKQIFQFCVSPQRSPTSVHVSSSGATSTGGGCSITRLAGEIDVHVSADSSAQQDHSGITSHPSSRSDNEGSGGTFTSFYLRDLCPQADSLQEKGPLVAA